MGVSTADRIRVAAYALCIRESLGMSSAQGAVEYIPSGEVRICTPQPRDRRAVLRAAEAVRHIREGRIPKKPLSRALHGVPVRGEVPRRRETPLGSLLGSDFGERDLRISPALR